MVRLYESISRTSVHVLNAFEEPVVSLEVGSVLVHVGILNIKMSDRWRGYEFYDHVFIDNRGRIVSGVEKAPCLRHFREIV